MAGTPATWIRNPKENDNRIPVAIMPLDKTGDHPNGKSQNSEESRQEKSGGSEEEVNSQSGVTN
jgi:hypothetical protein